MIPNDWPRWLILTHLFRKESLWQTTSRQNYQRLLESSPKQPRFTSWFQKETMCQIPKGICLKRNCWIDESSCRCQQPRFQRCHGKWTDLFTSSFHPEMIIFDRKWPDISGSFDCFDYRILGRLQNRRQKMASQSFWIRWRCWRWQNPLNNDSSKMAQYDDSWIWVHQYELKQTDHFIIYTSQNGPFNICKLIIKFQKS